MRKGAIRATAVATLVVLLTGCAVPGMQEGLNVGANPSTVEVEAAVDLYPISIATLRQLSDADGAVVSKTELPTVSERAYQYRIGPQDIIRVTVWDHPELNNPGASLGATPPIGSLSTANTAVFGSSSADSTARIVNDNGTMFYPYVGVIQVAGKTTDDLREYLANALKRTIRDPQVEVAVAGYRSQRVYVTGEVKAPGILPITDVPLLIADAISAAQGFSQDADLSSVQVTRGSKSYIVDLYSLLYRGDISQNLRLEAGDVVNVPEQRFKKVFVLGEVVKPTSLLLPRGNYSLTEALSDVGGASQLTALASSIYVIRGDPSGRIKVFQLDAAKPDALILGDQFLLRPRDIIFVDAAPIARFSRVVNQILPALQALQAGKYLGQ